MIVVSDTSPILNLHAVQKLDLLKLLYGEIVIPPGVELELFLNGLHLELSWVHVVAPGNQAEVAILQEQLDRGEAEALVVAGELHAELLLVDEKRGRRIAIGRGFEVTGLLGGLSRGQGARFHRRMQTTAGCHDSACRILDRRRLENTIPAGRERTGLTKR